MDYAIDPELLPLLELIPDSDPDDIVAARALAESFVDLINAGIDYSGVTIADLDVPGPADGATVSLRWFVPETALPAAGRPALLHIHGGGFISGSIDLELDFLVSTTRDLGIAIASVDYRLAPEHPFPAGVEDCYAALVWLHDRAAVLGVDPARIAVGGGSAGGGLAAAVALMARDRHGPPLCFQYLGIPELDHRLETVSMQRFTDTPLWNRPAAERSWEYYLGTVEGEVSPYASPSIADDLRGLPPAYVNTMEFDPLRDEGILYALRMLQAGVNVELHSYPGTFHGSQAVTSAAVTVRAREELMVALTRGLGIGDRS
jgi:acetyl esterase